MHTKHTPVHRAAEFASLTDEEWERILSDVDNGLGWATSESMSSADDEWVMDMLRRLVASRTA